MDCLRDLATLTTTIRLLKPQRIMSVDTPAKTKRKATIRNQDANLLNHMQVTQHLTLYYPS